MERIQNGIVLTQMQYKYYAKGCMGFIYMTLSWNTLTHTDSTFLLFNPTRENPDW